MKKYRVNYQQINHSRYGSYVYKNHEIVEAENEESAKKIVRDLWGKYENRGQHKLRITTVKEIA